MSKKLQTGKTTRNSVESHELPSLENSERNNFGHFSFVSEDFTKQQQLYQKIKKQKRSAVEKLMEQMKPKLDQNTRSLFKPKKSLNIATDASQKKVYFVQTGVMSGRADQTGADLFRLSQGNMSISSLDKSITRSESLTAKSNVGRPQHMKNKHNPIYKPQYKP